MSINDMDSKIKELRELRRMADELTARGVKLAVFPEFCLTGYTCGDLFLQRTLQQGRLHRILQRELIPALDLLPAEKVHRSLKDILRRAL